MSQYKSILEYLRTNGRTHYSVIAKELGMDLGRTSSMLGTLRQRGHLLPAAGDGYAEVSPEVAKAMPERKPWGTQARCPPQNTPQAILSHAVTLEWTPWNEEEGELGPSTRLTIRIGGFSRYIAQIVNNHGFKATVDYSDTRDTLIVITGATLAAVTRPLMALLTDAGVAAPPIPEPA